MLGCCMRAERRASLSSSFAVSLLPSVAPAGSFASGFVVFEHDQLAEPADAARDRRADDAGATTAEFHQHVIFLGAFVSFDRAARHGVRTSRHRNVRSKRSSCEGMTSSLNSHRSREGPSENTLHYANRRSHQQGTRDAPCALSKEATCHVLWQRETLRLGKLLRFGNF